MTIKIDVVQTVFLKSVGDSHSATFSGPPASSGSMYKKNGDYFTNVVVPMNKPVMVYAYFASKPMSKLEALAEILTKDSLKLYHDWIRTVVPASMHPAPKPLPFDDEAAKIAAASPMGMLTALNIATGVGCEPLADLIKDPIKPVDAKADKPKVNAKA